MKIWRILVACAFVSSIGLLPNEVIGAQRGARGAPPGVDHAAQGGQIGGVFEFCDVGGQAGVLVYIPGRSFVARTGPEGDFLLSYVPAGSWTLVFEQHGNVIHTEEDVFVSIRQATDLGIIASCPDQDNDGFDLSLDCDDLNPAVFPGAAEECNGIDDNCDGTVDEFCVECTDGDNDGFFVQEFCGTPVDCDDSNPAVNPNAPEVCFDGSDNNCDGVIDEGCTQCDVGAACNTGLAGQCGSGALDESCNCVQIILLSLKSATASTTTATA